MPYPNKRGGGGGGARSPVIVSGSPFSDADALEAWSVLNPQELVNNTTNYATSMAGGASYEWRGDNGVYSTNSWFRQNALTTIEQQNIDSIADLTLATIPMKGAAGLRDSIATQVGETQVMVDGELGSTKATVLIGQGLSLSEDGGTVRLDDEIENQSAIAVGTQLNSDGTTGINYAIRRHTFTSATVQPDQSETLVGRWAQHVPVSSPTRILKELRVRFAQDATGIRFTLRAASTQTQTDGIILFQSHTDSDWNRGAGYSVQESPIGAPESFSVPIDRSARVVENTLLYVVVEQNTQGVGDIELRGLNTTIGPVTGFFAYLEQDTVLEDQRVVALAEDNEHPVTMRREMPSAEDSLALASASINDNSALWIVANNQLANSNRSDAFINSLQPGFLDLNGDEIPTTATAANTIQLRGGTIVRVFGQNDFRVVNSPVFEGDIPTARTDSQIRSVTQAQLSAGPNITITQDGDQLVISSSGGGGTNPPADADRIYYGLSSSSDTTTINVATLTRENDPTDPDTISSGTATQGQYFVIYVPMTHDITSITDTVLSQDVTDLFTSLDNAQAVDTISFKSYIIGPLNAGFNESYVVEF